MTILPIILFFIGKRSFTDEIQFEYEQRSILVPLPLEKDPLLFKWAEHGRRMQRQVFTGNRNCQPDGIQHILFMLDTSGSIGSADFQRMTASLSRLVALMCKPVRIAAMTFNHDYKVEFCFNCFDNTCGGRGKMMNAMYNIPYRSGWTHSGGAARCACDFLLTLTCGIDPRASCIDVVFITDGRSNDPARDVCTEIQCLHNRFGVNTYAIGIRNYRQSELDCITKASNSMSIFNYNTFDEFSASLASVIARLIPDPNNNVQYTCIDPSQGAGNNSACS